MAPALGMISCDGGFLAIGLLLAGIDPRGYVLRLVAWALVTGRDLIDWCSTIPLASMTPQGAEIVLAAAVLGSVLLRQILFKFSQYVVANGTDNYATKAPVFTSNLSERLCPKIAP
jgi:hypothetical protein